MRSPLSARVCICVSLISAFEPGKLIRIGQFSLENNVILERDYSDILCEFCSRKSRDGMLVV